MSSLVGLDGNPLERQKDVKRRRQTSRMKKNTPWGDVLFQLTVDLPKDVSEDTYKALMVEYFGIGYEAFKAKL